MEPWAAGSQAQTSAPSRALRNQRRTDHGQPKGHRPEQEGTRRPVGLRGRWTPGSHGTPRGAPRRGPPPSPARRPQAHSRPRASWDPDLQRTAWPELLKTVPRTPQPGGVSDRVSHEPRAPTHSHGCGCHTPCLKRHGRGQREHGDPPQNAGHGQQRAGAAGMNVGSGFFKQENEPRHTCRLASPPVTAPRRPCPRKTRRRFRNRLAAVAGSAGRRPRRPRTGASCFFQVLLNLKF